MSVRSERSFDAVLFDWCGTLVEYPSTENRFRPVLERMGRPHDDASVADLVASFQRAERHPSAIESDLRCDLSVENHRESKLLICEIAGFDREFAVELERSFADFDTYPTYPETVDVIRSLADHGIRIAIVSDFHVDLRPHLISLGFMDEISGFVLSCEIGVTKPDPAMFRAARPVGLFGSHAEWRRKEGTFGLVVGAVSGVAVSNGRRSQGINATPATVAPVCRIPSGLRQ